MHPYILDITLLKKNSLNKVIYITLGKPDGLNIMLSKQKGICNFRLRPSVEENLQMCARQVVLSHISRYFEKCFKNQRMLFPSDMKNVNFSAFCCEKQLKLKEKSFFSCAATSYFVYFVVQFQLFPCIAKRFRDNDVVG